MNNSSVKIKEQIIKLPFNSLLLFCNLNCEKMLRSYEIFSNQKDWGNIDFFHDVIKNIYNRILQQDKVINGNKLIEELEINCPNLDEFSSISASYAFDFCCAVEELLQYLLTEDKEHVLNNSQHCMNTVDMFVQQKEGIDHVTFDHIKKLESLIENDEYMQKEVTRQLILLAEIAKNDIINEITVESLKALNTTYDPLIDYNLLL